MKTYEVRLDVAVEAESEEAALMKIYSPQGLGLADASFPWLVSIQTVECEEVQDDHYLKGDAY